MRARDLMTRPVVTVTPETAAKRAAEVLTEHGFTALPVVNDDDRLIGIVTEADLIRDRFPEDIRSEGRPDGQAVPGTTVAEVMTTPVTGMSAGADLAEVGRALLDGKIRAMPIVDGAKVVGILTRASSSCGPWRSTSIVSPWSSRTSCRSASWSRGVLAGC